MATLLSIFVRVIVPVMVMAAAGFVAARFIAFDLKSLARVGLYVMVPCLTFTAMARTTLAAGEFLRIVAFTAITIPVLLAISVFAAKRLRLSPDEAGAFHISIVFSNAVNFGFPVLLLAYGAGAIERGVVYAMVMQIAMQSLGIYLAARGREGFGGAMKRVWVMPGLYGMILGLAVRVLSIKVPAPIFDPLKLVGDSLVPFLLLVLGMQLASVKLQGHWKAATVATAIRLVVAAPVSIALAAGLGLTGMTRQAMILENCMPSAIFGVALAQEFDAAPALITKIIFLSTLASLLTLTVLITVA